jgi:hypothetical protein
MPKSRKQTMFNSKILSNGYSDLMRQLVPFFEWENFSENIGKLHSGCEAVKSTRFKHRH